MDFLSRLKQLISRQAVSNQSAKAIRRRPGSRHLPVQQLEERVLLSAPDANNILVSQAISTGQSRIFEYTLDGTLVQTLTTEFGSVDGAYPSTEYIRDIALDDAGNIQIYNGTFSPYQTELNPVSGTFVHRSFAEFSTANNISYGGLAVVGDYVFATDMKTNNADSIGLVRFDTRDGSAQAFSTSESYIDVELGLDGKLYAIRSGLETEVDVFNPQSVDLLETIVVAKGIRSIAVTQDGQLYGTNWSDHTLYHFDRMGTVVKQIELTHNPHDVNIRQDGKIIVGSSSGAVHVTDTSLAAFTSFDLTADRTNFVAFAVPTPLPGLVVTQTDGSTLVSESGSTDTIQISLNAKPDTSTLFTVITDTTEITVSPVDLTFTPDNWNVPQTVTLTGVPDTTVDGDQTVSITISVDSDVLDPIWANAEDFVIAAINTDIDTASVDIGVSDGSTSVSETGDSDSVTLVLPSKPLTNVTFEFTTDATDLALNPAELIFTPDNWNVAQVLMIDGVDNDYVDGDRTLTIDLTTKTGSDPAFMNVTETISVVSIDDDVANYVVSQTDVTTQVSESGTTDTVSIVLSARPRTQVAFAVTSSSQVATDVESVIFTPDNWNVSQVVTVSAVDDDTVTGNQNRLLRFSIIDADSNEKFHGLADSDIAVSVLDDDVAAFQLIESDGQTLVSETDLTDSFQIVLTSAPLGPVVLSIATDDTEIGLSSTEVTFGANDWNVPQTVNVAGVADNTVDADKQISVTVSVDDTQSEPLWLNVAGASITATNQNTDQAGVTVAVSGDSTTVSENGGSDTVDISLPARPLTNVTFDILADAAYLTINSVTVTFTPDNWNTTQTVTITAVDNSFVDGDRTLTVELKPTANSDPAFAGVMETIEVVATDDETAGFSVTQTNGSTAVSESGTTDTVSVVLSVQPRTNVSLSIATDTNFTADINSLTFTTDNWNTPQIVTLSTDDNDVANGTTTGSLAFAVVDSESDAAFHEVLDTSIDVTVIDDEVPAIIVNESEGSTSVSEDGLTDTFNVALAVAPLSPVVVRVDGGQPEVSASPAELTFTPANWNESQTVTVLGHDDEIVDGDQQVMLQVSIDDAQSDSAWSEVENATVDVTNSDNDAADLIIEITNGTTSVSEDGTQSDTFLVALSASPLTDVRINLTADSSRLTSDNSFLIFTPNNWNTPQAVSVTGVNNDTPDGDVTVPVTLTADATSSSEFQNVMASVDVVVTDDDVPGFTITGESFTLIEAGSAKDVAVVLNVKPNSNVIVAHTTSSQIELGRETTTFTPENWDVPQTLAIQATDDLLAEGTDEFPILFFIDDDQSDAAFHDVADFSLNITIEDDEVGGLTVTESDGGTVVSENGASDSIQISLNAEPVGNVTVQVASGNTAEVDILPEQSTIVFTPENWNVPISVQVDGVDDQLIDGDQQTSVVVSVVVDESHAAFAAAESVSVTVTTIDDEVQGFQLTETDNTTIVSEDGNTVDTVQIVLNSQPASDVTFNVNLTNENEATASPTTLVFTAANWDSPQTISITGVLDDLVDGSSETILTVSVVVESSDPAFATVGSQQLTVTTLDNDQHGDIDADDGHNTLTDGILLVRYLAGFSNQTLTEGAINPEGRRTDPTSIANFLAAGIDQYDIDGDGDVRTLTDGILYLRYLAGFRGPTLIDQAISPTGTRTTSQQVEAWLADIVNPPANGPIARHSMVRTAMAGPVPNASYAPGQVSELQTVTTTVSDVGLNSTTEVSIASTSAASVPFTYHAADRPADKLMDSLFESGIGDILDD